MASLSQLITSKAPPQGPVTLTSMNGKKVVTLPKFPSNLRPGPVGSGAWYLPDGTLVTVAPQKNPAGRTTGVNVTYGAPPTTTALGQTPPKIPTTKPVALPADEDTLAAIAAGSKFTGGITANPNGGIDLSTFPTAMDFKDIQVPNVPYQRIPLPQGADNSKAEAALLKSGLGADLNYGDYLPSAYKTALGYVSPQIKSALQLGAYENNNIERFNQGTQSALQGLSGQIGDIYDRAAAENTAVSRAIGASLANANPNATDQALLRTVGAPSGEAASLKSDLNNNFRLGGAVLGGRGLLNTSALQDAKANALSSAAQLPGLLDAQATQGIANVGMSTNANIAKIYSSVPGLATKIATGQLSGAKASAANSISVFKTLRQEDQNLQSRIIGVQKANASNNLRARTAAISAYNSAVTHTISAYRAAVTAWKAQHPAATATATGTLAKNLFLWRYGSQSKTTTASTTATGGKTGSETVTQHAPPRTYEQALTGARIALGPTATDDQVRSYVNMVYNQYGVAGRPLDPGMQQVLAGHNLPTGIQAIQYPKLDPKTGQPVLDENTGQPKLDPSKTKYYLTPQQFQALSAAGINPPAQPIHIPSLDAQGNVTRRDTVFVIGQGS